MTTIFGILVAFLLCIIFFTYVIWSKIKYSWLPLICRLLIISLPFEAIPSLSLAGANIRISQLLVILGLYFVTILFCQKNSELLAIKFNKSWTLTALFLVFSIPSWFFIIEANRFFISFVATILCFGALFLLSHFTQNVLERLKELTFVFIFVAFFGLYQFVGDLVFNLPPALTGLQQRYTKIVFGIPRVQATAIEPLYLAGMLYLPIFTTTFLILNKQKLLDKFHFYHANLYIWALFLVTFILTISKAGLSLLIFVFILIPIISFRRFEVKSIVQALTNLALVMSSGLIFAVIYFENITKILLEIWRNFIEIFTVQAVTARERATFLQVAFDILYYHPILGIGPGQFGVLSNFILRDIVDYQKSMGMQTGYFVVNNVYLEVWLEYGLLSFLIFMILILYPIYRNFKILSRPTTNWSENLNLSRLVLSLALVCNYIQWATFSPIFIMPIFILLGLIYRLDEMEIGEV